MGRQIKVIPFHSLFWFWVVRFICRPLECWWWDTNTHNAIWMWDWKVSVGVWIGSKDLKGPQLSIPKQATLIPDLFPEKYGARTLRSCAFFVWCGLGLTWDALRRTPSTLWNVTVRKIPRAYPVGEAFSISLYKCTTLILSVPTEMKRGRSKWTGEEERFACGWKNG